MRSDDWRPWGVLVGLFLVSSGLIAYAIAPASILPLFMEAFTIDKPAASASISAFFLTWAVLQVPGGYLLDRFDNRLMVFLAAVAFVAVAVGGLAAPTYAGFMVTRLLGGACAVFVVVGSVNILSSIIPPAREGLGVSLFIASPPFGVAFAQFVGPAVAEPYGWRAVILLYAAVSAVGLVIAVLLLRESVTGTEPVTARQFVAALRDPAVLLISVASFCTYAVWTFLNTWMPSFGTEVLGIELVAAGGAAALFPLAGMLSRPGGGWLSDKLGGRMKLVIVASFVSSAVLVALLSASPSPLAFAILLALTGAAVNLAVGLYLVYVNSLAVVSTQGTSLSVLLTFSQVGNLVAPVAGGWLITQVSWTAGFGFAVALALVGLATIWVTPSAT